MKVHTYLAHQLRFILVSANLGYDLGFTPLHPTSSHIPRSGMLGISSETSDADVAEILQYNDDR